MEKSKDADNYRVKKLERVIVQLVPLEASQQCTSLYHDTQVECDNLRVVNHGGTSK